MKPREFAKKIKTAMCVGVIGLLGVGLVSGFVYFGVPRSDGARILAAFAFWLCASTFILAALNALLLCERYYLGPKVSAFMAKLKEKHKH